MRLARTILVALIAVAVAAVPAAAGFVPPVKAVGPAAAHAMHTAAMPVDCDHHMPAPAHDQGSKPTRDCASMAACAANCFNYAGTAVPAVTPAPTASRLQPIAAADLVVSTIGSPPFRPPRV